MDLDNKSETYLIAVSTFFPFGNLFWAKMQAIFHQLRYMD